jgi:hypothetical protein
MIIHNQHLLDLSGVDSNKPFSVYPRLNFLLLKPLKPRMLSNTPNRLANLEELLVFEPEAELVLTID